MPDRKDLPKKRDSAKALSFYFIQKKHIPSFRQRYHIKKGQDIVMTENSVICQLIKNNPTDWQDIIKDRGINVKTDDNGFAIFTYEMNCDFTDPVVQEARGIIIDISNDEPDVVCRPYRKFGNLAEPYADSMDYSGVCVEQKVDGSIIKLWHNDKAGSWQWSTNGMIDASNAPIEGSGRSFMDVIKSTPDYKTVMKDISDRMLSPSLTYIFELVSPETQVVIDYKTPMLYLTGIRDNITGKETDPADDRKGCMGIRIPERYPLSSEKECLDAARKLNPVPGKIKYEGFVVVDKSVHNPDGSFNRVKIKSPEYIALHHAMGNGTIPAKKMIELIREGKQNELPQTYRNKAITAWYEAQLRNFEYAVSQYIDYARGLYEEYSHDRGAVAKEIKDDAMAGIGFSAIENEKTAEDIISGLRAGMIEQFIEPYRPIDIKIPKKAKRIQKQQSSRNAGQKIPVSDISIKDRIRAAEQQTLPAGNADDMIVKRKGEER